MILGKLVALGACFFIRKMRIIIIHTSWGLLDELLRTVLSYSSCSINEGTALTISMFMASKNKLENNKKNQYQGW